MLFSVLRRVETALGTPDLAELGRIYDLDPYIKSLAGVPVPIGPVPGSLGALRRPTRRSELSHRLGLPGHSGISFKSRSTNRRGMNRRVQQQSAAAPSAFRRYDIGAVTGLTVIGRQCARWRA